MPKALVSIKRARPSHLNGINTLLERNGLLPITIDKIYKDSVAIVACMGESVVGFIWLGLMARQTMAYIDHFVVHEDFSGYGVGHALATKAHKAIQSKKTDYIFGVIRLENPSYTKSSINALKMAFGSDGYTYTYIFSTLSKINKELENGRRR